MKKEHDGYVTPREVEREFYTTRDELSFRRYLALPPPWLKIYGCALYRRDDVSRHFPARSAVSDRIGGRDGHAGA